MKHEHASRSIPALWTGATVRVTALGALVIAAAACGERVAPAEPTGAPAQPAFASAPGTPLRTITAAASRPCTTTGGVAFDGENLLITCEDNRFIDVVRPSDGSLVRSIEVTSGFPAGLTVAGFGPAAYSATDNGLFVVLIIPTNTTFDRRLVNLVNLTTGASTNVRTVNATDALAYDGVDNTLWTGGGQSLAHYPRTGALLASYTLPGTAFDSRADPALGGLAGIAVGSGNFYLSNGSRRQIYVTTSRTLSSPVALDLLVTTEHPVYDLECDNLTFAASGDGAVWAQHGSTRTVTAYAIPSGACLYGGGGPLPNAPPVPTLRGPTSNITGQRLDYLTSVTDPNGDTPITCQIDFGDGSGFAPVNNCPAGAASHVYTTAGTFTITLRATDPGGLTGTATLTVTITASNLPPVPTLSGPATGAVGETLAFTTGATDPDGDAVTCEINFGDAAAYVPLASCSAGATHAYASAGTYAVVLRARDARGATNTVARTVVIGTANRPPTATLNVNPPTGLAPLAVSATTGASDPDGDALSCSLNWGDGSPAEPVPGCTAGGSHSYAAAGTYIVTLTARDPGGLAAQVTATVVVTAPDVNHPPDILNLRTFPEGMAGYPLNGTSCYAREQVCIKYTITDVDPNDNPFTTTVNWGDGSPTYAPNAIPNNGIPLLAFHRYAAAGTYTVTVTATDRRGASSTRTISVRIDP